MAYKKITQKQSDHIKHLYIDLNETLDLHANELSDKAA